MAALMITNATPNKKIPIYLLTSIAKLKEEPLQYLNISASTQRAIIPNIKKPVALVIVARKAKSIEAYSHMFLLFILSPLLPSSTSLLPHSQLSPFYSATKE
jgi:hypothetical protein